MLFALFSCILLLAATVHSAPAKDIFITNTCDGWVEKYSDCTARVQSVDGCTTAIVNFTNTSSAQCHGINFLWTQPANNLTMILETWLTKEHHAYKINLDNYSLMEGVKKVYQLINNKEIDVTTHTSILTLNSDSNYQVIVTFESLSGSTASAIGIRYEAVSS